MSLLLLLVSSQPLRDKNELFSKESESQGYRIVF